ncbi:Asp23/Gls24 family envelope stress response protein [Streptomyces sp. SBT349]|uniref:Asp23/Gls24 family envelope stress response protein n=1 Tax=Streptomyces sp. SBT349 TaxID=1580539 RepID=UPI00066BA744|nr:Asp23/Gls24 family envelope stress response protein [Streptomyces sp. SBT349]
MTETRTADPETPAGDRGATRITERVVAKLAAQAAREVLRPGGAMPEATAVVSRSPGTDGTGGLAAVRVAVELGYPSDIGAQCGAVRRHVADRILELAGMEASYVTVAVERLRSAHFHGDVTGRVR